MANLLQMQHPRRERLEEDLRSADIDQATIGQILDNTGQTHLRFRFQSLQNIVKHDEIRLLQKAVGKAKLHLVAKFNDTKEKLNQINQLAQESTSMGEQQCREQIRKIQQISNHLIENF